MELESRRKHIEDARDRFIEEHDAHLRKLYQLETEHAADLDVLTDIYGLNLLEVSDESSNTVDSWSSLLTALKSDADLVVIAAHYACTSVLVSTGSQRHMQYGTRFTVIDMAVSPDVEFIKGDGDTSSSVQLSGASTLILETKSNACAEQEFSGNDLMLAKSLDLATLQISRTGTERWFSCGVMNPATKFGAGVIGLKKGDDVSEAFKGLAHKDQDVFLGTSRIHEELERIFA